MNDNLKYRRLVKYQHSGDAVVNDVGVGKIFHVREGRNAWHSTWVVQYEKNSFYSSLKSAKEYAEDLRKSGSVFTILELPCLVIRSNKKTVVVTEVNIDRPLSNHVLDQELGNIKKEIASDYKARLGFLPDLIKGFMSTSLGWKRKILSQRLLLLEHTNADLKVKDIGGHLSVRISSSSGSDYYLSWSERRINANSDSIEKISSNLSSILKGEYESQGEVGHLEVSKEKKIRMLRSGLLQYMEKKRKLNADQQRVFVDMFISELEEAYTVRSISSANLENLCGMLDDWLAALAYFASEDRKEIMALNAIKASNKPFLLRRC